jgi:hypothetical protein
MRLRMFSTISCLKSDIVTRFSTLDFYANHLPLDPQLTPKNIFDFCFAFAEKLTNMCLSSTMPHSAGLVQRYET